MAKPVHRAALPSFEASVPPDGLRRASQHHLFRLGTATKRARLGAESERKMARINLGHRVDSRRRRPPMDCPVSDLGPYRFL